MVRVQVGDEDAVELGDGQAVDAGAVRGGGAMDDSRAAVNEVWGVVDDDGKSGAGTIRIRIRRACAEEDQPRCC